MSRKIEINWKTIIFVVFFSLVLAMFFDFAPNVKINFELKHDLNFTYQDLAATLLTAVAVIVTTLGVGIAVLTIFGARHIKKASVDAAQNYVAASIEKDDGHLNKLVRKETKEIVYGSLKTTAYTEDWSEEEENE